MEPSRATSDLASLGRGLVQLNLRLNRITELLESKPASSPDAAPNDLLDLLDAVDRVLATASPVVALPAWQRWLGVAPSPGVDLSGLRLAREQAVASLAAAGLRPTPTTGAVDPRLHRVVDVRATLDPALDHTIAHTHSTGWHRPGEPPTPVRHAIVSAWRRQETP